MGLPEVEPRYEPGLHRLYDSALREAVSRSGLLGPGSLRLESYEHASDRSLAAVLKECEARVERLNGLLSDCEREQSRRAARAVKEGRRPSKKMDPDLEEIRLTLEARADVTATEVSFVEGLISNRANQTKAEEKRQVLLYGPIGVGKLRGGVLVLLDGQRIAADEAGELVISEPESPYHGMTVPDYREKIILPFKAGRAQEMKAFMARPEQEKGPDKLPPGLRTFTKAEWSSFPPRPAD